MWCFLIGKQKVVLFPTFREMKGKGRKAARNALRQEKGKESSKNEGHPFIFFLSFCFAKDKG